MGDGYLRLVLCEKLFNTKIIHHLMASFCFYLCSREVVLDRGRENSRLLDMPKGLPLLQEVHNAFQVGLQLHPTRGFLSLQRLKQIKS